MTAESDPYKALELAPGSSLEQVKEQYRRLAKEHHPDLNPRDRARSEERLRSLNAAYAVLSNPAQKALLDLRWSQRRAAGMGTERAGAGTASHAGGVSRAGKNRAENSRAATAAASATQSMRQMTPAERRRIRMAATFLGVVLTLAVVGAVYFEWAQPPPPSRVGIAPSLRAGLAGHTSAPADNWTRAEREPPPAPSPAPDTTAIAVPLPTDGKSVLVKQVLQQRMDAVDPKIRSLGSEAQNDANSDAQIQGGSPERIRWRTQLLADARAMLLQRDTVRLEVESLSENPPPSALTQIKADSQQLERQYRELMTELRQRPY